MNSKKYFECLQCRGLIKSTWRGANSSPAITCVCVAQITKSLVIRIKVRV